MQQSCIMTAASCNLLQWTPFAQRHQTLHIKSFQEIKCGVKTKNNADQYLLKGFAMEQDVSPCEMD
jgi:hypothetical protein